MHTRIHGNLTLLLIFALLVSVSAGCGDSSDDGLTLEDIPRYPDAVAGESMGQSDSGGVAAGQLEQFTTIDSFEDVVDFYTDALHQYDPETLSHTSELGRQTVFTIQRSRKMISVAIQEFTEEKQVNITLMAVGS